MPDCLLAGILTGRVEEELLTPADPQLAATRRILLGSGEDRTEEEEGQLGGQFLGKLIEIVPLQFRLSQRMMNGGNRLVLKH